MAEEGSYANLPFAGGNAGQNALTPAAPGVGQLVRPPKLVQGNPPRTEEEFNSLFADAKAYLERPDVRAFLLQAGVQMLQPRPPGVPFISQVGQAVGAGSQAALGVQKREEEQRRFDVQEKRAQQRLGLEARRVATGEKAEERQRVQGARRLDILSEANNIARLRVAAINSGNSLDRQKLEEAKRQFDAELERRNREHAAEVTRWQNDRTAKAEAGDKAYNRALILQTSRILTQRATQATNLIKTETEALALEKPGSPEYKARIARIKELEKEARFNTGKAEKMLQEQLRGATGEPSERGGSVPGPRAGITTPSGTAATARPAPMMSASDLSVIRREGNQERALQRIKEGAIRAPAEYVKRLETDVRGQTEKRRAKLPEGPESVDFDTLERRARRPSSRSLPGSLTGTQNVVNALTIDKSTIRTSDDYSSLDTKDQKRVQTNLNIVFPKGKPPRDAKIWQAVLHYPILQNYLRGRYGKEKAAQLIEQARKNFREGAEARAAIRERKEEARRQEREALSGR